MVDNERNISRDLDDEEVRVDLMELFRTVLSKLHIIILVGVVFAGIAFAGTKFLVTPQYTAETKLYVLSKHSGYETATYSDLQLGDEMTGNFIELVKSRPVLEETVSRLDLEMSADALRGSVSVEGIKHTCVLRIKVNNPDPEMAKQIADTLREVASAQLMEVMEVDVANVVEEANLPTSPSSPNVMKNAVLAGFVGCVLAVAVILLIFMLDDTIKTQDDVRKYLDLSVLASVPVKPDAESIKRLRTNIMLSGVHNKVIMLTSCAPDEGKSTIALSLAKSFVESGKRVLLIDADFRKSVLAGHVGAHEEMKGLCHYLAGQAEANEILFRMEEEKLDVIVAGAVPPNPTELLGQKQFDEFVRSAGDSYDYIIIDTPALGKVIDPAAIARVCDASALVLSTGKISCKFAREVKEQLERTKCPVLGVVFNKVEKRRNKYFGKYYG